MRQSVDMALIKLGSIVTGISGKLGGQTFGSGRSGAYVRNTGSIARSPSKLQMNRRVAMGEISQIWKTLTPSQRTAWNNGAAGLTYKNRLGEDKVPSGYQLFMQRNAYLRMAGQNLVTIYTTGDAPGAADVVFGDLEGGEVSLELGEIPTGQIMAVFLSGARSPGERLTRQGMTYFNRWTSVNSMTTVNVTSQFEGKYGKAVEGMNYFVYGILIDQNTGIAGQKGQVESEEAS